MLHKQKNIYLTKITIQTIQNENEIENQIATAKNMRKKQNQNEIFNGDHKRSEIF